MRKRREKKKRKREKRRKGRGVNQFGYGDNEDKFQQLFGYFLTPTKPFSGIMKVIFTISNNHNNINSKKIPQRKKPEFFHKIVEIESKNHQQKKQKLNLEQFLLPIFHNNPKPVAIVRRSVLRGEALKGEK